MATDDAKTARLPCPWCGLESSGADTRRPGRCPHCGAPLTTARAPEPYVLAEPIPPAPPPPVPPPAPSRRTVRVAWRDFFHETARRGSLLEGEIVALVLLSVADLMTTYHLLRAHPKFYESNPIAQFVFARWDIAGMAVFKFSVVAFVVVVGEVVERRRPGLGRFVILVGCLASALVVFQGMRLAFGHLGGE
ncbi:DUF5658 family protein [Paludisphaera soli]|uniref:DUF5658 family protein n=1 Tax=Paludisphaera soli TaxID=2712865 RepID=UPI0013ECABFF|nr:DUF5658 family protein [Paludisphaera soli]